MERWFVDRDSPVGLRRRDALGGLAVQNRRIEFAWLAGGVEFLHRARQPFRADIELSRQLLQRVRLTLRHLADAILIARHVVRLVVEYLHRHALRLLHHLTAVFGVGVVAPVGTLIDEALAVGVDHDADRIGMLLVIVEHDAIAERWRAEVPLHGMTR